MITLKGDVEPPAYSEDSRGASASETRSIYIGERSTPTEIEPTPARTQTGENHFRARSETLREAINAYKVARTENRGEETMKYHQANVLRCTVHDVADASLSPQVKELYQKKAKRFMKASTRGEKDIIIHDLGRTVVHLLSAPFAIIAAGFYLAGTILEVTGQMLKGVGDMFGMRLRKRQRVNDDWDT
ncbi:hypothetical protein D9757_002265 [Collybiopsis confluens]|uniref:Uncharacterized protein n=1 Tax=Collybiopsis confluens TaxID=2823264 RepID=A0A8H5MFZ4_9AGAR|nr:hypothetical protein D9757_002265 [Collybiopsis confluens]